MAYVLGGAVGHSGGGVMGLLYRLMVGNALFAAV